MVPYMKLTSVKSDVLKTFGRPLRAITCECERTAEPSMVQVLHISNGDTINGKLSAKGNRLEQMLAGKMSDAQIIEEAYLAGFSRFPTDAEKSKLSTALAETEAAGRRQAIEDLYWSILSTKEFLFNH